jgi:hypothetical protein
MTQATVIEGGRKKNNVECVYRGMYYSILIDFPNTFNDV